MSDQSLNSFFVDRYATRRPARHLVVLNLEPEGLEKIPQDDFRSRGELFLCDRELVQEPR